MNKEDEIETCPNPFYYMGVFRPLCGDWHEQRLCDQCHQVRRQCRLGVVNRLRSPLAELPQWNAEEKTWSMQCGETWPARDFLLAKNHQCPTCTEHRRNVRALRRRSRTKPLLESAVLAINSAMQNVAPVARHAQKRSVDDWATLFVQRRKERATRRDRFTRKPKSFTAADVMWTRALLFESKVKPCFAKANIRVATDWTPLAARRLIETLAQVDGIWKLHEFEFCFEELLDFAKWLRLKGVGLIEEPFFDVAKWGIPRGIEKIRWSLIVDEEAKTLLSDDCFFIVGSEQRGMAASRYKPLPPVFA